jgi:DNA modification methylase
MTTQRKQAQVLHLSIGLLKPLSRNARKHSERQVHQIATAIKEFGFTNPILIDENHVVLAGHGRLAAAQQLRMNEVPTICIEHLTDAQKRAYVIADNRLAEKAGWDRDILAIELEELAALDLTFDVEITGFETAEIELLTEEIPKPKEKSELDAIPSLPNVPVTRLGDVWILSEHKIICADAQQLSSLEQLMGSERARVVFADPPYNVPIQGHVCGLGKIKHREFAMASGEMSDTEFVTFLENVFTRAKSFSTDGSIHFICMDWRHAEHVLKVGRAVYSDLKNICVWNKDNGGMGSFYRSKHEFVFVYKAGTAAHLNNIELGRHGRYRTNVWDYRGVNSAGAARMEQLAMHPTVKPTALIIDALKDCSRRDDIVLDPFGGSGTTLIAAEKSKRRARLIEIEPAYVDVAIQRWQKLTGRSAFHSCGATFSHVSASRASERQSQIDLGVHK